MSNQTKPDDDFDDVLDEFSAPPTSAAEAPSKAPTPAQTEPLDLEDDDFLAEFAKNMRAFLSDQTQQGAAAAAAAATTGAPPEAEAQNRGAPSQDSAEPLTKEEEERIKRLFAEAIEKDFGIPNDGSHPAQSDFGAGISEQDVQDAFNLIDQRLGSPQPGPSTQGTSNAANAQPGSSYQDTLRATAERLKSSEQSARQASASGASDAGSQADLARLLASLGDGSGGHGLPGEDDEEGLQDAIELMMGQLMSKDLLYEPMADLKARYPEYLQQHGPTLPSEERERYEKQNTLVNQIVAVFDRPNYSDDDAAQKEEVVSLMTRMQECGTPPKEMMGDLPPGLDFGNGSMPDLDSCPTS